MSNQMTILKKEILHMLLDDMACTRDDKCPTITPQPVEARVGIVSIISKDPEADDNVVPPVCFDHRSLGQL